MKPIIDLTDTAASAADVIRSTNEPARSQRMSELARMPKRPPLTAQRAEQLVKLANEVRSRAKARSGLYGLRPSVAADIRRAIAYIDDTALFFRKHK